MLHTKFSEFINERQISPERVKRMKYETVLPLSDEIFINAVHNTPGAKITEEGLYIDTTRNQKEEQAGELSVRTGVFYLPRNDKNAKYYSGKLSYGGTDRFTGEILIKKPLFVKGATGGKAPENAYDAINGKGSYREMRNDVTSKIGMRKNPEDFAELLTKYNADTDYDDNYDMAYHIVDNSKKGNTLAYAMQENIVAHSVRGAGYDSIIGYSKRRDGNYFISEIFDIREITYPSHDYESDIHPDFTS